MCLLLATLAGGPRTPGGLTDTDNKVNVSIERHGVCLYLGLVRQWR